MNNKLFKIFLISTFVLFCFLISVSHSYGQNNKLKHFDDYVILTDKKSEYPLGLHLEIFEDKTGELTIENVVDKPFTPSKQKIPNLGTKTSAIWVRFRVINEAKSLEKWQLILADSRMGNIDVYIPQDNRQDFITKKTGRYLPFDTREVKHRYFIFHLPLKYQQKKTIYLRLTSKSVMVFPLLISTPENFTTKDQGEILFIGIVIGVFFFVCISSLFLFISLKDADYFYYTLFNLTTLIFKVYQSGIAQQFLFPNFLNHFEIQLLSGYLGSLTILKFAHSFLRIKNSNNNLHRITIFLFFTITFLGIITFSISHYSLVPVIYLIYIVICSFILITTLIRLKQGFIPARYFLLGLCTDLIVLILICINTTINLNSDNTLAFKIYDIGMMVSMCLFSFALADKIKLIKQQQKEAQQQLLNNIQLNEKLIREQNITLEQKIKEKTQELEETLEKLTERDTQLRLAMDISGASAWERNLKTNQIFFWTLANLSYPLNMSYDEAMKAVHSDDREVLNNAHQEAIKNKDTFQIEHRVMDTENINQWRWLQVTAKVITDAQNIPIKIVGMSIDISEHKKIELELITAKEKAEIANQAKSTFIANMSHELRTPLNAVLGFSQIMMRSQDLSQEHRDNTTIINKSGNYLLTLINNILDLSKIEAGKITLNANSFDFYSFLNELEDLLHITAENKGLTLIFDHQDDVPQYIYTDETKLRQVLINLINNGIKFTSEGGVSVTIGNQKESPSDLLLKKGENEESPLNSPLESQKESPFSSSLESQKESPLSSSLESQKESPLSSSLESQKEFPLSSSLESQKEFPLSSSLESQKESPLNSSLERGENKATIIFEVRDTGAGIAEAEMSKLFEAFSQTETGKNSQEGTGLGLPISRKFVNLMGGDITVKSQVGKGTTFRFDIQVEVVNETEIETQENPLHVIALKPNQVRYKILIVDDRSINRLLLIKLLQPLGFELKEATNGKEAIEIWSEWQPHLIWMDMRMPIMDGYEATQYIKSTTKGNATAIIALTASVLEEQKAIILSAGCDDFVRKPFREATIFETMKKHLGVEYIYAEEIPSPTPTELSSLTVEHLQIMPPEWLEKVYYAAKTLDDDMMEELIEQIPAQESLLGEKLSVLVNDYQFKTIRQLIESLNQDRL